MLYDLTTEMSADLVVYPGDPQFCMNTIRSLDSGDSFNLIQLCLHNHLGTHIDFPAHVIKDGKTSHEYSLEYLEGQGCIVELAENEKSVTKAFIESQNTIFEGDIIFFKTVNSNRDKKQRNYSEDFVYIGLQAAQTLIDKKVKIVGIDYLSVDSAFAEELPVHKMLLSAGILIIENLNLSQVPAGRGVIEIRPLNICEMDGLPARVTLRR